MAESKILKKKKKFTKTNRAIIRLKQKLGIYGICFWAPFFLSVPIGSIIVAKFYGKQREAFPLIIVGMFLNAFLMTSLSYLLFH
jgi:prolipoprotein diacylglyceryltransferase